MHWINNRLLHALFLLPYCRSPDLFNPTAVKQMIPCRPAFYKAAITGIPTNVVKIFPAICADQFCS